VLRTGTGATGYLDRARLDAVGISVEVATYPSPAYPQGPKARTTCIPPYLACTNPGYGP